MDYQAKVLSDRTLFEKENELKILFQEQKNVIRRVQEQEVVINQSVSVGMFGWQLRSAFSRNRKINKLDEK